jgi:hypothetical protein
VERSTASPEEVGLRFVELHYGRELAAGLRAFLAAHLRQGAAELGVADLLARAIEESRRA